MTSIYFTEKLQALVNAYQINDHRDCQKNVEFMSHLYQLFLADDKDLCSNVTEAVEDVIGVALQEWAKAQATVYGKHVEIADKALGVVIAEALREWVWSKFLDYWETGEPDQVLGQKKYEHRQNAPLKMVS